MKKFDPSCFLKKKKELFKLPTSRWNDGATGENMVNFIIMVKMMMKKGFHQREFLFCFILAFLTACAGPSTDIYRDPNMDFGTIQSVAVMPFANLTREAPAAERVRDVFMNTLLSTGAVYVVPPGEVFRGIGRLEIQNAIAPSPEEMVKLGGFIKVQAIFTGVVREYGELRSGNTVSSTVSLSLQLVETQTGKIVWTGTSTQGGITIWNRLFGGGGQPMNQITEKAVNDIIDKLFK